VGVEKFVYHDGADMDLEPKWKTAPELIEAFKFEENDSVFKEIYLEMKADWGKQNLGRGIKRYVERLTDLYQVELVLRGTANLVNTIVEHNQSGEPIETLVFLDKSARNLAYVFTEMWLRLEQENILTAETKRPEIRFLNVNNDNGQMYVLVPEMERSLLAERLRPQDFIGKKVAIIDEYTETGGTLKKTQEMLRKMYGTKAIRMAGLYNLPGWYGGKDFGVLGITDLNLGTRYREVKELLREASEEELFLLTEAAQRLGREKFVKKAFRITEDPEWKEIEAVMMNLGMLRGDGLFVWHCIDSAGELLGRPLNDKHLEQNNRLIRELLKSMVNRLIDKKLS